MILDALATDTLLAAWLISTITSDFILFDLAFRHTDSLLSRVLSALFDRYHTHFSTGAYKLGDSRNQPLMDPCLPDLLKVFLHAVKCFCNHFLGNAE